MFGNLRKAKLWSSLLWGNCYVKEFSICHKGVRYKYKMITIAEWLQLIPSAIIWWLCFPLCSTMFYLLISVISNLFKVVLRLKCMETAALKYYIKTPLCKFVLQLLNRHLKWWIGFAQINTEHLTHGTYTSRPLLQCFQAYVILWYWIADYSIVLFVSFTANPIELSGM